MTTYALHYPVEVTPDDNDTLMITFPDFPEATTFGDTLEEVLFHATDCLETVLAYRMKEGGDIPEPSKAGKHKTVCPGPNVAAKVLLYISMRDKKVTKAELARKLDWKYPQVDRLLNPKHTSHIGQFTAAFSALGERLTVGVESWR